MEKKLRIGTLKTTHVKSKHKNKIIINSRKSKYVVPDGTIPVESVSALFNI